MVQESVTGAKMNENQSEERKWSKPIMEKRRRERINQSLDELKRLVLEAQNRDSSRYTKLEKADILEMTVKHLRGLQSRRKSATSMACQSLIPTGVNVGCRRCLIDVGHCVIPDNVVMKTRKRTQNMSHLVGISSNARERMYGPVPQGPVSQGVVAQSQTCQPLHGNPAVQFIPICSSHLSNSNVFPGTHESSQPYCLPKGGHFWRPF